MEGIDVRTGKVFVRTFRALQLKVSVSLAPLGLFDGEHEDQAFRLLGLVLDTEQLLLLRHLRRWISLDFPPGQ